MSIKIIVTGGTFDKEYDEIEGRLFFKETHIHEMLRSARCSLDVDIETLMMKDSLEMTEEDKKSIINKCKNAKQDKIVITHGTDRMVETAKVLASSIKNKTIVLTGAMIPIKFGSSDGLFNLGSSLAFVQILPTGVYVSMNGKYYHWNNVRKNKKIGKFESLMEANAQNGENKYTIRIDNASIEIFIKTIKDFVGAKVNDSLSMEDIYSIAANFNLNGIIYLEKFEDKRHVNILLGLNEDTMVLYDPLSGIKIRPYNETQFGLYCKPVGSFKDEYWKYERQYDFENSSNIWEKYKQRGKALYEFLKNNKDFHAIYSNGISNKIDFPILQGNMSSSDCVPLSLFVISICTSLSLKN